VCRRRGAQGHEGFTVRRQGTEDGHQGLAHTELYFENCYIPAIGIIGEPGTGLKTALKTLGHTRPTWAHKLSALRRALDVAIATRRIASNSARSFRAFKPFNSKLRNGDEGRGGELMVVHRGGTWPTAGSPTPSSLRCKMLRIRRAMDVTESAVQLMAVRDTPATSRRANDAHAKITRYMRAPPNSAHRDVSRIVGSLKLT